MYDISSSLFFVCLGFFFVLEQEKNYFLLSETNEDIQKMLSLTNARKCKKLPYVNKLKRKKNITLFIIINYNSMYNHRNKSSSLIFCFQLWGNGKVAYQ